MAQSAAPAPAPVSSPATPWWRSQVLGAAIVTAILAVVTQVLGWKLPGGVSWVAAVPVLTAAVMLVLWGIHVVSSDLASRRSPLQPTASQASTWETKFEGLLSAFVSYMQAHETAAQQEAATATGRLAAIAESILPLLIHTTATQATAETTAAKTTAGAVSAVAASLAGAQPAAAAAPVEPAPAAVVAPAAVPPVVELSGMGGATG